MWRPVFIPGQDAAPVLVLRSFRNRSGRGYELEVKFGWARSPSLRGLGQSLPTNLG
jgi:hypothetical protein